MKQTLILLALYIIWLVLGIAFYFMYITSMATALGIPNRPWVMNDLAEGLPVAMVTAVVFTAISWGIIALIQSKLKK